MQRSPPLRWWHGLRVQRRTADFAVPWPVALRAARRGGVGSGRPRSPPPLVRPPPLMRNVGTKDVNNTQGIWGSATTEAAGRAPASLAAEEPTPMPSPQEIHHVVCRAAQQGAWTHALKLFRGAVRLRCVPLTSTYGVVLEAATMGGGWQVAMALVDELATSPLSTATLCHTVADMLLLQLLQGTAASAASYPSMNLDTAAAQPALVPFLAAAIDRGVALAPRHRCAVWEALLSHSTRAEAAAAVHMATRVDALLAQGGTDGAMPWLASWRERTALARAAAMSADWRFARRLLLTLLATSPSAVGVDALSSAAGVLVDCLHAYEDSLREVQTCSDPGDALKIPWEEAVGQVLQLLPLYSDTARGDDTSVEAAVQSLRTAAEAASRAGHAPQHRTAAKVQAVLKELEALEGAAEAEVLPQVRRTVGSANMAWSVLKRNATRMEAGGATEGRILVAARVLCSFSRELLAATHVETIVSQCFPVPPSRPIADRPHATVPPVLVPLAFECVVSAVCTSATEALPPLVSEDNEKGPREPGIEVLGLVAALLYYLNHIGLKEHHLPALHTAHQRAFSLVRSVALAVDSPKGTTDGIYAQAILRATLGAPACLLHEGDAVATENADDTAALDPAATLMWGEVTGASLIARCLDALQPSVLSFLLRPETALAILCGAASEADSAPVWAAAVAYYHRLQRRGWATREAKDALEGALAAAAPAPTATRATAAHHYAWRQWKWEGSVAPLRRLALPMLAATGQWSGVEELLGVLSTASVAPDAAELEYGLRARQARLEGDVRAAAERGDGPAVWRAWRAADDTLRWQLHPEVLVMACSALFSSAARDDGSGGMSAEADELLACHCALCRGGSPPAVGGQSDLGDLHTLPARALWLYHQVRGGHILVGEAGGGAAVDLTEAIAASVQQLGLAKLPAVRSEAELLWRCAASAALGMREGGDAGCRLLLHTLQAALAEDMQRHYHPPEDEEHALAPCARTDSPVGSRLLDLSVLLSSPWLLCVLPDVLLQGVTGFSRKNSEAAEGGLEWALRALLVPVAKTFVGADAWTRLLLELRFGPKLSADAAALASRCAVHFMSLVAPSDLARVPLDVVRVATDGAFLRQPQWSLVATILCQWTPPQQQQQQQHDPSMLATYQQLAAQAATSLAAVGSVAEAVVCAEAAMRYADPPLYACDQATHGTVERGGARLKAEVVLSWVLRAGQVGGPPDWLSEYLDMLAALDEAVNLSWACAVMTRLARAAPWELTVAGWRRLQRAAPFADWASPHLDGAASSALLEVVLAMERQGGGPEDALRLARMQTAELGVPVNPAVYLAVARMVLAEGPVGPGGFFPVTDATVSRCAAQLAELSRLRGEQRVTARVLAAGVGGEAALWARPIAPPRSEPLARLLAAAHPAESAASTGMMHDAQLDAVAVVAPLLVVASPRHLEQLSRSVLGGTLRPLALLEALHTHRPQVMQRLSHATAGTVDMTVVESLAHNQQLLARLTEAWRQWRAAQRGDGSRPHERPQDAFPVEMAHSVFNGYISVPCAQALWHRCQEDVLRLERCRWPLAAEAELRAAAIQGWGKVPRQLVAAPKFSARDIGHYWSIFHGVVVPELQFTPLELCCIARYMDRVEAAVAPANGRGGPRDWHAKAFLDLVSTIHAAHFAPKGATEFEEQGTASSAVVGVRRPLWAVAAIIRLSHKQLRRLMEQLHRDEDGQRLYTMETVAPPAQETTHPHATSRFSLVAALASAASAARSSPSAGLCTAAQQTFLPLLAAAVRHEEPSAQVETQVRRIMEAAPGVDRAMVVRAVEKPRPAAGPLPVAVPSPGLRALVRVCQSYAAVRQPVPPQASVALVEAVKGLGMAAEASAGQLSSAEWRALAQAGAAQQLWVWRSLCQRSGATLSPLPFLTTAHAAALRKIICATRDDIRGLPEKHGTTAAAVNPTGNS